MKVHVYLLCYNEEDILPFVLAHYEKFCSRIFVLDNMSTDSSKAIAESHPLVTVIQWDSGGKIDEMNYIRLKENTYKDYSREGGKHSDEVADWVITADMDELIYHPEILDQLSRFKKDGVTVTKTIGFNMCSDFFPEYGRDIKSQVRFGARSKPFDKPIVFDPVLDMFFGVGCHPGGARFEKTKSNPKYKESAVPLFLLHYNNIGDRFVTKAVRSGARLSENNLEKGWGKIYVSGEDNLRRIAGNWERQAVELIAEDGAILWDEE